MVHSMEPMPSRTDDLQKAEETSAGGGWIFPALLVVILLVATVVAQNYRLRRKPGPDPGSPVTWTPYPKASGETVALEIDYGNGVKKHFAALPWRTDMTVESLMEEAQHFRPGTNFEQIGEGESGFLSSLDGFANEGAGGRNWNYEVDGRNGQVSFCVQQLAPGSLVLWKFARKD